MEERVSQNSQSEIQQKVEKLYNILSLNLKSKSYKDYVVLNKEDHIAFCLRSIFNLPRGVSSLSSGQPWILYWLLHALNLLGHEVPAEVQEKIVEFLSECKCQKTGVFAGGPLQAPHLAPIYSTLCALISHA